MNEIILTLFIAQLSTILKSIEHDRKEMVCIVHNRYTYNHPLVVQTYR